LQLTKLYSKIFSIPRDLKFWFHIWRWL